MAKLVPLFSGSKGNSYYIGSSDGGILIDAGKSCRQIETALSQNNIDIRSVRGVFVTHEHTDHCSALNILTKKYGFPVFASEGTLNALVRDNRIFAGTAIDVIKDSIVLGDMQVNRFETSHDAAESCGYCVTTRENSRVSIATDTGYLTDSARTYIKKSNVAVIESNHDINMLKNGSYPYILKRRILSDIGHLSNDDCSKELNDFVESGVTRFVLAHLSEENNYPALALETAVCQLTMAEKKRGEDYEISIAPPQNNGKAILF